MSKTPKEGARDIKSTAIIVSLSPDVCKTPVGSSTPPVPYPVVSYLSDDANTSGDVYITGKRSHHMGSLVTQTLGDEAGKAGGVKSGTVGSVCHPKTHSSSVRINGQWAVRHTDEWYMNNKNTVGKLTYIRDTAVYEPTPEPSAETTASVLERIANLVGPDADLGLANVMSFAATELTPTRSAGITEANVRVTGAEEYSECPETCEAAWEAANADVRHIQGIEDPIERNVAITKAYRDLGDAWPENRWIRLAGYVSTQGGCAMQSAQKLGSDFGDFFGVIDQEAIMEALKDINTTIFSSVYPPNKFMHLCGYERLEECNSSGAIQPPINRNLMKGLEEIHNGNLAEGADLIAYHEQVEVVQPLYEKHKEAVNDMLWADQRDITEDNTSIPVSYKCTRWGKVRWGNLDIRKPLDRVGYYERLMERMLEIESGQ